MLKSINRMLINGMVAMLFFVSIFVALGIQPLQLIDQVKQNVNIIQNIKDGQGQLGGLLSQIDQATR